LFKPSEVYACLQDVPINVTLAVAQIDWIQQFISFQSTLAYLKEPPSSYPFPAVDIVAGLDSIRNKADAGTYENEYDFEYDVFKLLQKSQEGHLSFRPFLVYAFSYFRRAPLVSFSTQPSDLPRVYFLCKYHCSCSRDFSESKKSGRPRTNNFTADIESDDTSYTPGSIVSIDGKPVDKALVELADKFQDEDALYNAMFYNAATASQDPYKGKYNISPFIVNSDNTTYQLSNGTSRVINNSVIPSISLDGVESGQDIFDMFLDPATEDEDEDGESAPATPTNTTTPPATTTTPASKPTSTAPKCDGCIEPFISDEEDAILGYFLPSDPATAVLNIQSFEASNPAQFQAVVQDFLAQSADANKTRLIIDVRGNPGGSSFAGYDTFKQLFPQLPIINRNRFRMHPAADIIGSVLSQLPSLTVGEIDALGNLDNKTRSNSSSPEVVDVVIKVSPFNYHTSLKRFGGPEFSSWQDLSGPLVDHGDNFTETFSWQFANTALDLVSSGIVVSGFANDTGIADQVFDRSNVTVVRIPLLCRAHYVNQTRHADSAHPDHRRRLLVNLFDLHESAAHASKRPEYRRWRASLQITHGCYRRHPRDTSPPGVPDPSIRKGGTQPPPPRHYGSFFRDPQSTAHQQHRCLRRWLRR
jgi:hypothetical protein